MWYNDSIKQRTRSSHENRRKIKRVRLHRHMKQRELGELVGFTDGAANRIAQYESGFRVPKEDMVKNSSGTQCS